MKIFLDTSVLVASAREPDGRHEASFKLLSLCTPQQASCAAHTLAELYATLTGMQPPNRFQPEQALSVLRTVKARLACIALSAEEVFQTVDRTADLKLPGGIIYDALILACARKAKVERIFTWNAKHFQMVAPDLAERIVTP